MTTEIDRQNIIYTARMDGKEEGLAEGRAEGLAKGRVEGREEGLAEGLVKGTRNTALNLKNLGVDIETIMKATGLTEEEVFSL